MIPFNDLRPAVQQQRPAYEAACKRVFDRGWFVLGPEVEGFEAEFAAYHGSGRHAVGVAHGTDAIELALRAAGVGPGDEVITTALTAAATVCAILRAGARPIFADVDEESCTLSPAAVRAAITPRTRAVIPVHLYGRPAEMFGLLEVARTAGLLVIEDCAQAHGARLRGQQVGTFGHLAAFSFYPTKNLGAFGDAGAVLTGDQQLAERVRLLRNYGQATRYHHIEKGINSRLDDLQAALLRVSLAHLEEHNKERRRLAFRYQRQLTHVRLMTGNEDCHHVYHLLVVRHSRRDALRAGLEKRRIGTLIHYPRPLHLQPAYSDLGYGPGSLPHTEQATREVLSLPLYVGLTDVEVDAVCSAISASIEEDARCPQK